MNIRAQVVLIGFMGAGKTKVGRALAGLLRTDYTDLDSVIEEHASLSIAEIFAQRGEIAMRELEAQATRQWLDAGSGVLATGGGVVETPATSDSLRQHSPVVWLDPPFEELRERLERAPAGQRPLVQRLGWEGLVELRDRRRPLYAGCADFRFQEPRASAHEMALQVRRVLQEARGE
jgi:shikimate kinase